VSEKKYLSRNVKRENDLQYGDWPLTADVRRDFILNSNAYDTDPSLKIGMDIWEKAAERFDAFKNGRVFDGGASTAYFIEKLLERGHGINNEVVGIDTQAEPFYMVEERLAKKFGHRNLVLKEGDVTKIDYPDNWFQATSGQYVIYHVPRSDKFLSELHRVSEPSGHTILASREPEHLGNSYSMARILAKAKNATMPDENFYSHYSFTKLVETLDQSPKYKVIDVVEQMEDRGVEPNDEGWQQILGVVLSYLPLMKKPNGRQLRYSEVISYAETQLRQDCFESFAADCGGQFPELIRQGFVVAEVIK
jgi:ubiquinone/menaquinone biosynthesis C-methylase UbiE